MGQLRYLERAADQSRQRPSSVPNRGATHPFNPRNPRDYTFKQSQSLLRNSLTATVPSLERLVCPACGRKSSVRPRESSFKDSGESETLRDFHRSGDGADTGLAF